MAGFLGQDWSFGNLKNRAGGLLEDPTQLNQNPWFQMGTGLLGAKPGEEWQAIRTGLAGAQKSQEAKADRERQEDMRKRMEELIRMQSVATGQVPGMTINPLTGEPMETAGDPGLQGQREQAQRSGLSSPLTNQLLQQMYWKNMIGNR